MFKRVIIFVMDSVGIGALPDSEQFGDKNVDTLGHIWESNQGIIIPHLIQLGIGNIEGMTVIPKAEHPTAAFGRALEFSNGKDTTTGHWEIAGLHLPNAFNSYPEGFPPHVIEAFEKRVGRKALVNKPYSGTVILEEYGEEHMRTGNPIVYTSADSVFQIAAHEEVIPLDELYKMCEIAREILMGKDAVARVIARPFIGTPGKFERTSNRRDYSLSPEAPTILDQLKEEGFQVRSVGKIYDIFNGQGLTHEIHTKDNMHGIDETIRALNEDFTGLVFTNLVDFDAKFGHRRDPVGYGKALEEMDSRLPEIMAAMNPEDVLIITADHGNDPTYIGTDHTREYIPILVYGENIKAGVNLGTRTSFSDIAATTNDLLGASAPKHGVSFKNEILK